MDSKDYYEKVFEKLERGFEYSPYLKTSGHDAELRRIMQERSPSDGNGAWGLIEPVDSLRDLTVNHGLEIYIPTIGKNSSRVLSALDYEVKLDDDRRYYSSKESQKHYVIDYILPVTKFVSGLLVGMKIPHSVDMTPSGGHFLFWVKNGTKEWREVVSIGHLEDDLKNGYDYTEPDNQRRNPAVGQEAGYAYSGIGRLWEYLSRRAIEEFSNWDKELRMAISDPFEDNFNMDLTCYGYPAYLRTMRAPFSLHRKRQRVIPDSPPLVDVMLYEYDGHSVLHEIDLKVLVDTMWDLQLAAEHAKEFSGEIPTADNNLVRLVEEYKRSRLYQIYSDFDKEPSMKPQEAFALACQTDGLNGQTHEVLERPNPIALNPKYLMRFVDDFANKGWHPKRIANLLSDLYEQNHGWNEDWILNCADTRANFWVRNYYSLLSSRVR